MKVFVSYLIQDTSGQKHASEVINLPGKNPPFNACEAPSLESIQSWLDQKQIDLNIAEKPILLCMSRVS